MIEYIYICIRDTLRSTVCVRHEYHQHFLQKRGTVWILKNLQSCRLSSRGCERGSPPILRGALAHFHLGVAFVELALPQNIRDPLRESRADFAEVSRNYVTSIWLMHSTYLAIFSIPPPLATIQRTFYHIMWCVTGVHKATSFEVSHTV